MKIGLTNAWKRFTQDTRGTLTAFVLVNFVMMVLAAGIAIDIVRYEQQRACFQSVLDNGVLTASSLRNSTDPVEVVERALEKSDCNLDYVYNEPEINTGATPNYTATFREINASIDAKFDTYFLSFFGYDSFNMEIAAGAKESNPHTEISLVLDTSGSMDNQVYDDNGNLILNDQGTAFIRIDELRPAAVEFAQTVFQANVDPQDPRVSISVIPYAGSTNPGEAIAEFYDPKTLPYSNCFQFTSGSHSTTNLNLPSDGSREYHAALFAPDNYGYQMGIPNPNCKAGNSNTILPVSQDLTKITEMIQGVNGVGGLEANGSTGIDDAVKWGVSLLDPSAKPLIQHLNGLTNSDGSPATDHHQYVEDALASRPSEYNEGTDTITNNKFLIIMTDGQNDGEYKPYDYGDAYANAWMNSSGDQVKTYNPGSGWTRLRYPELWSMVSAQYWTRAHGQGLYVSTYNSYVGAKSSSSARDTNLKAICDAFKAQEANMAPGTVLRIYTISFHAPSAGQAVMNYCASDGHYYPIDEDNGVNISDVFQSIAGSIETLKMIH